MYLKVPFSYPFNPPEVRFLTRIFHPNVSRHGDIGIDSIQQHNWVSGLTIPKVLLIGFKVHIRIQRKPQKYDEISKKKLTLNTYIAIFKESFGDFVIFLWPSQNTLTLFCSAHVNNQS